MCLLFRRRALDSLAWKCYCSGQLLFDIYAFFGKFLCGVVHSELHLGVGPHGPHMWYTSHTYNTV